MERVPFSTWQRSEALVLDVWVAGGDEVTEIHGLRAGSVTTVGGPTAAFCLRICEFDR